MQPHHGSGNPMNSSQLQELQRLQQEMQTRMRQRHQRQSSQGNTNPMMQQQSINMQMGNQQAGNRNSFTGGMSSTAIFLLQQQQQQQQQQQRRMSSGEMSNPSSAQAALYWNAMQANNAVAGQGLRNSQSSMSGMTSVDPSSAPSGNSPPSMQQAVQRQQQQQQYMGSSSSSFLGGGSQPQLAAGGTGEQLLIQQRKIMADLQRQLQQHKQQGSMNSNSHRRTSSSSAGSLNGSQRQALFQMQQQRENSLSSALGGGMHDQGGMPVSQNSQGSLVAGAPQDRRSSIGSVEPISLASIMESQSEAARRSSVGSQSSFGSMGQQMFAGSSSGGGQGILMQQQAQLQQQLSSGVLPARVGQNVPSLGQQLMAAGFPERVSMGVRREASIDSNATMKVSNRSKVTRKISDIPPEKSSGTSATGKQYMEGTFEGGWQSNADLPERREVIFSIVKLVEQMRPEADKASQKLPEMAKRLEEHLYRSARSKEEYLDSSTLKKRLQNVAHGLDFNRSPSEARKSPQGSRQKPPMQLSEIERRTKSLQQQLQQMRQLQKLQQQGATEDYLNEQAKLIQMQEAGLSSASQPASQSTPDSAAAAHPGILKTSTKYQDPASSQRQKVVKQQQQRLLLLRHASKCKAGAACKTKFCGQMVALWQHMKKCRDKNCKTSHCLSSRCVLNHYRMCKSENKTMTCEVCAPVMRQIKMQKTSQEGDDAGLKDDTQADSATGTLPVKPNGARAPESEEEAQRKQRQLEELDAARQKLHQQQMLLKQLRQQQAHLLEQQKQLREQQRCVQPETEQGMQLQQQQGLLQQLQQLFQQQQLLLQQEVAQESQETQGEVSELSSIDTATDAPEVATRTPESRTISPTKRRSSSSSKSRGRRKSIGKSLKAMEPAVKESSMSTSGSLKLSPASKKRPADQITETEADGAEDTRSRSAKEARLENNSVLQRKVLQQGNAEHNTSLIQSMTVAAIERHLASLNDKIHVTPQTISQRCLPIVRNLIGDQFGWVFRDPVDPVALGLPDYYDVIKTPMHLALVERKLEKSEYSDMEAVARDTRVVFNNAILYNGEDSEVGEMAAIMLRHFDKDFKAVLRDIDRAQGNLKDRDDSCTLCGVHRRLFEPVTLYCNGACGMQRIRRNATYYTDHTKLNHWCTSCFGDLDDKELILLEDGSEVRKSSLQKFKNDGLPEEAWVQCDECSGWVHQVCALFNGRRNKNAAAYRCPKCHVDKCREGDLIESETRVKSAKDLPHCKMSLSIEAGLHKALASAYEEKAMELGVDVAEVERAEGLFVRVVSNMEKKHVVRDEMYKRYCENGAASEFPVRSKCIALFQNIDGVDVILFAMYVYEYDDSCPAPNRRRVYVSYLDSVYYFQPKCYRSIAYHALIVEYLRYVKERGFHTAHIWSCPPSEGDDYVFYSHPKEQLIPREDMLLQWYHSMLEKAQDEGVVLETLTLYDEYFKNNGIDAPSASSADPTCLPYFDGDYIPGEIENIIKQISDEQQGTVQECLAEPSKEIEILEGNVSKPDDSSQDTQDKVMLRLGQALYNMRQNFMVARLRSKDFIAAVERGEDVTDWIDPEEGSGESASKRAKIGSKDSNCLSQLPEYQRKILAEKTGTIAGDTGENPSIDDKEKEKTVATAEVDASGDHSVDGQDIARSTGETDESAKSSLGITPNGGNVKAAPSDQTEVKAQAEETAQAASQGTGKPQGDSADSTKQNPADDSKDVTKDASPATSRVSEPTVSSDQQDSTEASSSKKGESAPLPSEKSNNAPVSVNDKVLVETTTSMAASKDDKDAKLSAKEPGSAVSASSETTAAVGGGNDEKANGKQESTTKPKEEPRDSSKRSLDEMQPTLSRHFSSARSNAKTIGTTLDEDDPQETEMFESRQQFLNYCQANHFQFDELRRAKHSSMMILFQLHNPSAPMFLQQCGACYRDITHGIRYHCNDCSNFDLCQDCYEPVTTGLWAKRDSRFTHNKRHTFVAIDMEKPADTQKSRDERTRTIKLHLELLSHAATCDGPPGCSLNNCQRMKTLFQHVNSCEVTYRKGCKICQRLLSLLTIHARMCTVRGSCPLPFCDRIRERNKRRRQQQQLMDDRRRQAQNELYRRESSA